MPMVSQSSTISSTRRFSTSAARNDENPSKGGTESQAITGAEKKELAGQTRLGSTGSGFHKHMEKRYFPGYWVKLCLVGMGVYKSTAEVPKEIPYGLYTKVRTWFRIRFGAVTMIAVLISSHIVIQRGKRAVAEEHVRQRIIWHQEIEEKYQASKNRDDKT